MGLDRALCPTDLCMDTWVYEVWAFDCARALLFLESDLISSVVAREILESWQWAIILILFLRTICKPNMSLGQWM
jgi:hypothetical protein